MFWKCVASIVVVILATLFIILSDNNNTNSFFEITYLQDSHLSYEYILPENLMTRIHELCDQSNVTCKHIKYGTFEMHEQGITDRAVNGHYMDMAAISESWAFGYLKDKTQYNILSNAIRLKYESELDPPIE